MSTLTDLKNAIRALKSLIAMVNRGLMYWFADLIGIGIFPITLFLLGIAFGKFDDQVFPIWSQVLRLIDIDGILPKTLPSHMHIAFFLMAFVVAVICVIFNLYLIMSRDYVNRLRVMQMSVLMATDIPEVQ